MRSVSKTVGRLVTSLLFLGWGAVSVAANAMRLSAPSVTVIAGLLLGALMAAAGILGLFHVKPPLCRLLGLILFVLSGVFFLVSIVWHLIDLQVGVSWGSLVTAFLSALYLAML